MTTQPPGEHHHTATPADVLAFEAATPSAYTVGAGAATRIRDRYGMTTTRYHQVLEALLDANGPHLSGMLTIDPITTHALIDRRWRLQHERARLTRTNTTPASPRCESGGHPGCTCDICY